MFQFPAFASVIDGWHAFSMPGCPIRISADQGSFAPPRGFSQLITSFVACKSLGIHRAPFLAFLSLPPTPSQRKEEGKQNILKVHYSIVCFLFFRLCLCNMSINNLVENIGFEPMASCMPCKRSSQLS